MLQRHRRVAVGMVVGAIAAGAALVNATASTATTGGNAPAAVERVVGAIRADGTSVGTAPQWLVRRASPGRYVLAFADDVALDVDSWELPATMTMRPTTPGTWIIDFVDGEAPVDTAFTFSALP